MLSQARRFMAAFWAYAGSAGASAIALVALAALVEGLGLTLLAPILGVVTGAAPQGRWLGWVVTATAWAGAHTPGQRLGLLLAAFVVLMLARAVILYIRDLRLAALQLGFLRERRSRIIQALAAASWSRVAGLSHARVNSLLTTDMQRLTVATNFLIQGGVALGVLLVQGAIAFALSPAVALVAAALLIGGAVILGPTLRRSRDIGGAVSKAQISLLAGMSGFLAGLKSAIAQNLQAAFVAELEQAQGELTDQQRAFFARQAAGRMVFAIVSAVGAASAAFASLTLLHVSPVILIALIVLFTRMSAPALQIQQAAQQLANVLPVFDALCGLENELTAGEGEGDGERTPPPAGALRFEGVSYRHPDGAVLGPIDLEAAPGEILGLVGPSGAGKTTLADLACGLLAPAGGRVSVGGVPLTGAALRGWRDQVAYVSQDAFIFHDTIRRNLSWAAPQAPEAEIWRALELAGSAELVRARGLDALTGERGALLSGGERQRLALARALLRNPRFLVLDEATNAIDVEAEAGILRRLSALPERPTILVIAHRSESLAACSRLLRLGDGGLG